ncbi:flagellar protein FliS [Scopulibacillus darangshiensis]|uniref:Flagellar secretion chaperone FliS n=1 Tax=Scopulibacillus darangshiensis TaxID=442528 RepID=A0A4R2NWQ5_9BACL|nr:flagellar export chaperone FliS [Scopulibacillus darangshiensis]TCP26034.1 flagellar protein FliS [Scopulibacillus darangshiensis]
MSFSPYQAYQQNTVTTAAPGELTLMLYNGCLKFINKGREGISGRNIEMKNTNLIKAQAIVQELIVTLDQGQPVADMMLPLYDYINRRLMEANVQSDAAILDEVEGLVTEFRDTWKQVIQSNRVKQHAARGGA